MFVVHVGSFVWYVGGLVGVCAGIGMDYTEARGL